jgi:hypothetical protein
LLEVFKHHPVRLNDVDSLVVAVAVIDVDYAYGFAVVNPFMSRMSSMATTLKVGAGVKMSAIIFARRYDST